MAAEATSRRISDLSPRILGNVFKFLEDPKDKGSVALTCRQWNKIMTLQKIKEQDLGTVGSDIIETPRPRLRGCFSFFEQLEWNEWKTLGKIVMGFFLTAIYLFLTVRLVYFGKTYPIISAICRSVWLILVITGKMEICWRSFFVGIIFLSMMIAVYKIELLIKY